MSDLVIDGTDPNNFSNTVLPEETTRRRIMLHAKKIGCEVEMRRIFNKIDNLLRNCTNEKERREISQLGIWEIYSLLGKGGELYVDGQLVYSEKDKNKIIV